ASTHQHYMQRGPEYYIKLAQEKSVLLPQMIQTIFEREKIPELAFQSCDALLSLQRKVDPVIFEKACRIAFENDLLSYKRLESIIKQCAKEEAPPDPPSLPEHNNVRGKNYYS